jgi:hypothetical protein
MTKEEILKRYEIHQIHISGIVYEMMKKVQVEKAMDEYAKQDSIAFVEWFAVRGYVRSNWYHDRWYVPIIAPDTISSEQLYELYNKQK